MGKTHRIASWARALAAAAGLLPLAAWPYSTGSAVCSVDSVPFAQHPATPVTTGWSLGAAPSYSPGTRIVGGKPLSSVLRGGEGSCSQPAPQLGDRDVGLDGTTQGWWVYFNFSASRVDG